jgi:hypothetical protein
MRTACLALLALALTGCPKHVERVAGSDDSRIDDATARLEELQFKAQSEAQSCLDRCAVARQTCEVAEELCGLVGSHPDRTDLTPRCGQGREQCAQANADCTRCQNG